MIGLLTASLAVPRTDAGFSATTSNTANSFAAAASFSTAFYLHNDPSPPTGDTGTQEPLPLDATTPTATTLYNYSTNFDSAPGRALEQSTLGLSETNTRRIQHWAYPVGTGFTIDSSSELSIWLAPRDSTPNKTVGLIVGLYDCNSTLSSCTLLVSAQNSGTPWPTTQTEMTIPLGSVSHVFAAGQSLVIKVVPTSSTDTAVAMAYDTTGYPSAFTIGP
jgi:hypothetical protein